MKQGPQMTPPGFQKSVTNVTSGFYRTAADRKCYWRRVASRSVVPAASFRHRQSFQNGTQGRRRCG